MNIKKRHITSCFPPSQGGLGWVFSCLFLMFFLMSSCQEDEIPHDTTEVMMTFTTRAFVEATQGDTVSTHLNEEKMKDLRVIMVRENGEIVGNHKEENINQTSVTFTFRTPVKTGGENFTFFAIANEGSVTPAINTSLIERAEGNSYSSDELNSLKSYQIGNSAFVLSENQPIPQTKQWIIKVPQQDTKIDNQRLEYVASKILVEFRNQTNKPQTLKNIKLTGIAKPTSGYLFKLDANDFVGTQQGASDITLIGEEGITLATEASDSVKYYTYPVNDISNAQLVATWEGVGERTLAFDGITSLPRNQQLKIIVTLTGQELTVNYTIADWEEHDTNIGGTSPTPEGGYDTEDWIADSNTDVVIGEEPEQGGGEEPEVPSGETGEVEVWSGSQAINWSEEGKNLVVEFSWLENAATGKGLNDIEGIQMYAYITITGTGNMQIRKVGDTSNTQYDGLYLNDSKTGWIGGLSGEKISVFIPNDVVDTQFYFTGQNYTITKLTVVKITQ